MITFLHLIMMILYQLCERSHNVYSLQYFTTFVLMAQEDITGRVNVKSIEFIGPPPPIILLYSLASQKVCRIYLTIVEKASRFIFR